jgi:hypothetical protein
MVYFDSVFIMMALVASSLSSPFSAADLIEKPTYLKRIAPNQLHRLAYYRASHTLNSSQDEFMDKLVTVVRTADATGVEDLKIEANALFGPKEALNLLMGGAPNLETNPEPVALSRRWQEDCNCHYGWVCEHWAPGIRCNSSQYSGCRPWKPGCGILWMYVCNGHCINYKEWVESTGRLDVPD